MPAGLTLFRAEPIAGGALIPVGKRIFSTVLLWSVLGAALWYFRTGGALVLTTLISMLTLRAFYQLMRGCGYTPFDKLGTFFGGLITIAPWIEAQPSFHWGHTHLFIAFATV